MGNERADHTDVVHQWQQRPAKRLEGAMIDARERHRGHQWAEGKSHGVAEMRITAIQGLDWRGEEWIS
jgi:hypothetical protein